MLEESTKKELRELYKLCGKIKDFDVIKKLLDLNINGNSAIAKRIIARQCAFNYKKYGNILFSSFSRIISEEDMLSQDDIDIILSELMIINPKIKVKSIKEDLLNSLLQRVSKKIGERYFITGRIDIRFDNLKLKTLKKLESYVMKYINSNYFRQILRNPNISRQEKIRYVKYGITYLNKLEIQAKIMGIYDTLLKEYENNISSGESWEKYLERRIEKEMKIEDQDTGR